MDVWEQVVVDMRHRVGSKVALVFVEALMAAAAKRNGPLFFVLGDISRYSWRVQPNLLSLASILCEERLEKQQQHLRSKESNMLEASSSAVPACQVVDLGSSSTTPRVHRGLDLETSNPPATRGERRATLETSPVFACPVMKD